MHAGFDTQVGGRRADLQGLGSQPCALHNGLMCRVVSYAGWIDGDHTDCRTDHGDDALDHLSGLYRLSRQVHNFFKDEGRFLGTVRPEAVLAAIEGARLRRETAS